MTSAEENRRASIEFVEEVFNKHNLAYLDNALADDFRDVSAPPGQPGTKQSTIDWFGMLMKSSPDNRCEVIQTIASGNKVVVHSRFTGTDTGGFMPGMEPTGKTYTMESIDISEFDENGKQATHYGITDMMGAMMQLGLAPAPG